jgi:ferredoxin
VDSPYDVLGVDPDAGDAAVLDAYRERVKETHPDRGGSASEFRAVQEAYERIKSGEADGDRAGSRSDDRGGNGRRTGGGRWRDRRRARPEDAADPDEPETHRVEYLNYEVLDDYGWELDDDDLFEKAAAAPLDVVDYGHFHVEDGNSLLEAAEEYGFAWPFACRGGACTNCAVAVVEGDVPPPVSHVLPPEMIDKGIRLSCITAPTTEETKVVYNVKHMPGVEELLLPASRFERKYSD